MVNFQKQLSIASDGRAPYPSQDTPVIVGVAADSGCGKSEGLAAIDPIEIRWFELVGNVSVVHLNFPGCYPVNFEKKCVLSLEGIY